MGNNCGTHPALFSRHLTLQHLRNINLLDFSIFDVLDACLMVHGSWLKAHGSWPREARGGSWPMAHGSWPRGAGQTLTPEGAPGPDPAGPGAPSGPRAGPAPVGHEP